MIACLAAAAVIGRPGTIHDRIFGIGSSISGGVAKLTDSSELGDATKAFNTWHEQQGQYPNYTQSELIERSEVAWGAGMDVAWCTPRDVVLTSFTASGTVSRLLIDGKKVGDVAGRVQCPADLVNPLPWTR